MSARPLRVLALRDARDAFSDWRVVLPMVVLTLFLPVLIKAAAGYTIRFVDEPGFGAKLIPFCLLLVGFVPASFSLIPALETFVGERERNTLESLLSAPIGERWLYFGKFLAGLLPTVTSSMLAMTTFSLVVWTSRNSLLWGTLPLYAVIAVMLLVLAKAALMTAAAVMISSRATTIRSASLLAACVIIPMSILVQLEAFLMIGDPPQIWAIALIGVLMVLLFAVTLWAGLRSFNREDVLSREHLPIRARTVQAEPAISRGRAGRSYMVIVYRELRDTLTDWRMLVPIALLTFLLPLLILGALLYAQTQVAATQLTRLLPFIVLLVGFLPASFSLITALEAFVGEKERGSLESLMSMPLRDWELYAGKLLAALILPLFSGLIAMLIFMAGLLISAPGSLSSSMTLERLTQMLAMVIIVSLTMVSGAVVISSHTSSVRVANLLASFILLPMSIVIQMTALLVLARRWDLMGLICLLLLAVCGLLVNAGMHSFNREEILSRDHEPLNLRSLGATFRAFYRQYGPVTQPAEQRLPYASLGRFYRQELPAMLRELRGTLLLVLGGVAASIMMGLYFDPWHETELMQLLVPVENVGRVPTGGLGLVLGIFVGNVWRVMLTALLATLTFGVVPYLVPLFAFVAVAHGADWAAAHGKPLGALGFLLAYVLPHGLFELPAAILGAAAGLRIGFAMATTPATITIGRNLLWSLALFFKLFLYLIVPLLFVGALIEGLVTPYVAGLVYR